MVQKKDIGKLVEENQGEILDFLRELVETESPTEEREAVHSLGEKLWEHFSPFLPEKKVLGDEYRVFRFSKGKGKSVFLGHLDTVHPIGTLKRNPFRIEDGKVFGPGALDMKGGIVAFYFALKFSHSLGEVPDLALLLNTEEEKGSAHTLDHMRRLGKGYKYCFGLEPASSGGKLKTSRKGVISLKIEVKGRRAHAGLAPDKGINAIDELINQLQQLREWVKLNEGSFSIGIIRGGEKPNVIPGEALAVVDIRFEEEGFAEKLRKYMSEVTPVLKGALVNMGFNSYVPPLQPNLAQRKLYSRLKKFFSSQGIELEETSSPGGADSSWFAKWGLASTDGWGPEGEGAHSEREFVYLNSLKERIVILTLLLLHLKSLAP